MSVFGVLFQSALKGGGELLINVGVSGVLEGLFPPFQTKEPEESRFAYEVRNLVEATLEVGAYLLISGTVATAWGDMFAPYELAKLPYGALLMFWLLENAMWKLKSFVAFINYRMRHRHTRKGITSLLPRGLDEPSQEDPSSQGDDPAPVADPLPGIDGVPSRD